MAEFINSLTGTRMWVAPERVEEYVRAGHRPVEDSAGAGAKAAPAPVKAPRAAGKRQPAQK